jgi:hypothetical protein
VIAHVVLEPHLAAGAARDLFHRIGLVALLLALPLLGFFWVVVWFAWPRWLVPPNLRHEQSPWELRRGRRLR